MLCMIPQKKHLAEHSPPCGSTGRNGDFVSKLHVLNMTDIGSAFPVINKGMAFHITNILILPLLEKYMDSLYILKSMQVMLEIILRYHQYYKLLSLLV